jgi:hypothetical protein
MIVDNAIDEKAARAKADEDDDAALARAAETVKSTLQCNRVLTRSPSNDAIHEIVRDARKKLRVRLWRRGWRLTRFNYRNEELRNEILDVIAGVSWDAIRAWQTAEEGRPRLTVQRVRDEADNCLFAIDQADDCQWVTATAVDIVLLSLGRGEAQNFL